MRQRITFLIVALVAAVVTTWITAAEEKPQSEFGDLIEVSEVLLDVLVTNRDGEVILGLGSDDFIVKEEGKPIPLNAASFYSNRFEIRDDDPARVKKPAANEVPSDRHFIFFFHDQLRRSGEANQLVRQQFDAARQTRRWIKEEMLPGDWVAIVSYDVKLKVQQDFTRSRESLLRAVGQATQGKDPKNAWKSRRPDVVEGIPSLAAQLPTGNELRDKTTRIYDGLRLVAESTREIVGRKNLIFFSTGMGRLDNSLGNQIAINDERFYPQLKQTLNDNNVAVYSVDLTPQGWTSAQQNTLAEVSSDTGGKYFSTFTNFITPLQQIADEANGYYLLSYQAEHPAGEVGYRKVTIETRDKSFKVKARRGYRYGT